MSWEYEVWRDEQNCRHFRIKGSTDDMQLESWKWWDLHDVHYGSVLIRRYDVIDKKHRMGFCPPNHPLVQALGLVHSSMGETENRTDACQTVTRMVNT